MPEIAWKRWARIQKLPERTLRDWIDVLIKSEVLPPTARLGGLRGAYGPRKAKIGASSASEYDKLIQRLAEIAEQGNPGAAIRAIEVILDEKRSKMGAVGPSEPLVDEERSARLAKILVACSKAVIDRALELYYEETGLQDTPTDDGTPSS
jgi:hypothetical protein